MLTLNALRASAALRELFLLALKNKGDVFSGLTEREYCEMRSRKHFSLYLLFHSNLFSKYHRVIVHNICIIIRK